MAPFPLNELFTLILAILAILLGVAMNARWAKLRASNIPPAVLGGLVFACAFAILHSTLGFEIEFASGNRAALLLIFFVGLGLAAKFSGLRQGGVQVAFFCGVIAFMVVAQNTVGVALAKAFGLRARAGAFRREHPARWAGTEPRPRGRRLPKLRDFRARSSSALRLRHSDLSPAAWSPGPVATAALANCARAPADSAGRGTGASCKYRRSARSSPTS